MASLGCSDSRLSITANIIGILTFVYAVVASIYLYVRTTTTQLLVSEQEMYDASIWVEARMSDVRAIAERIGRMKGGIGGSETEVEKAQLFDRAVRLVKTLQREAHEIAPLLHKIGVHERSRSRSKRFASRARWLAERDTFVERRKAFEELHAELNELSQRAPFL